MLSMVTIAIIWVSIHLSAETGLSNDCGCDILFSQSFNPPFGGDGFKDSDPQLGELSCTNVSIHLSAETGLRNDDIVVIRKR